MPLTVLTVLYPNEKPNNAQLENNPLLRAIDDTAIGVQIFFQVIRVLDVQSVLTCVKSHLV